MYTLFADTLLIFHLFFIIYVVAGGLLVLRWPLTARLHIPAALWGALVEFTGWICPLTQLENRFRRLSCAEGYSDDVVTHYITPVIYPADLTPDTKMLLGSIVVLVNIAIYSFILFGHKFGKHPKR